MLNMNSLILFILTYVINYCYSILHFDYYTSTRLLTAMSTVSILSIPAISQLLSIYRINNNFSIKHNFNTQSHTNVHIIVRYKNRQCHRI